MHPRRLARRVAFAAPLVITLAVAPACSRSAAPTTVTPTNPPAPDRPEPPAGDAKPGAWEQVGDQWQYRYDDGDTVHVDDDGTCRRFFDADCGGSDDPTVEAPTCNPPPPQDVPCPPGRPES